MPQQITLEYAVNEIPRWGHGKPPHPELYQLIDRRRDVYARYLLDFLAHTDDLATIPVNAGGAPEDPYWLNGYFSGLDALSLHGLIVSSRPRRYIEIGSGNSTKFASRAIRRHRLDTHILSIDPNPRAEIDKLCDRVIRQPLEQVDLSIFSGLRAGDILFFDGSHCCFTNNDTTVFFLEVLPRLPAGVFVHVHDIFLPYDYVPHFRGRVYSEQYLLACYLLGAPLDILFPAAFIARDPQFQQMLLNWSQRIPAGDVETDGVSFWMMTR